MKIFTLVVDANEQPRTIGDLTLQDVKSIMETLIIQQTYDAAFEAGRKSINKPSALKPDWRNTDG